MNTDRIWEYANKRKGFVTFLILVVVPFLKVFMHHFIFPSRSHYDFSEHISLLFEDKFFLFIPSIIIVILVIWNFSDKIDNMIFSIKSILVKIDNNQASWNSPEIKSDSTQKNTINSEEKLKNSKTTESKFELKKNDDSKEFKGVFENLDFLGSINKFFKSKYFETFYTFYISWFVLTFIDKIIIPILKGATYINGSITSNTIVGSLAEIIGYFLFFYFPIKLLVMLFDKKHKWPTNIAYHIIPYAIYFWVKFTI
jgi:hypothetical protein